MHDIKMLSKVAFSKLRICRPPPPPPSLSSFFFKIRQIYMKDAETAESKEKVKFQIFPNFIFRLMVIFVLNTVNFS